ncbi:MAG: divalent-cation tolerance protein CutA [Chlamydiia bacterium]|nr:divalent-cation tolerance protein CutA [Chlamydiia bacterium]MCP5510077.1 divalent-cation tolerance protein CutA [Chlamydiales bacterium]
MIEIQWLSESIEEAKKISRTLVDEGLVACANILPGITSIYVWGKHVEESEEIMCLFKAPEENYDEIEAIIVDQCSYDMPAITKKEVEGYEPYVKWVNEG